MTTITLDDLVPGQEVVYWLRDDDTTYQAELYGVLGMGLGVVRDGQHETLRWEELALWFSGREFREMSQTSLRERAANAAAEQRAQEAEKEREHQQDLATVLRRVLRDRLDVEVDELDQPSVEVDGIRFGLDSEYGGYHLYLWGRCPHCGELAKSSDIFDLARLGQLLDRFEPHDYRHRHRECLLPVNSSAAEKLGNLLIDLIDERIAQAS